VERLCERNLLSNKPPLKEGWRGGPGEAHSQEQLIPPGAQKIKVLLVHPVWVLRKRKIPQNGKEEHSGTHCESLRAPKQLSSSWGLQTWDVAICRYSHLAVVGGLWSHSKCPRAVKETGNRPYSWVDGVTGNLSIALSWL
jgi:hypothetical protein